MSHSATSLASQFAAFLPRYRSRPFVWGECDCCLFAADWLNARCGIDPASELRGRYHNAFGAARVLQRLGLRSVAQLGDRHLGARLPPLALQRGDIALVQQDDLPPALGIVWGDAVWAMAEHGAVALARTHIVCGWSVPCPR